MMFITRHFLSAGKWMSSATLKRNLRLCLQRIAHFPPLADLVSNPTPSGIITHDRKSHILGRLGRV